jgi:hypothetical protein
VELSAPKVHGEVRVNRAQAGDALVFECSDFSFCRITAMDVRWNQLVLDGFFAEEFLYCC